MGKEKVVNKLSNLEKAFYTLQLALTKLQETPEDHEDYVFFRDSLIQRFEYCTDMFWKAIREFLIHTHGLEVPASPKGVMKEALDVHLLNLSEYEQLIASINDRNLTSHAYRESIAIQIASHVLSYYQLMQKIIVKVKNEMDPRS